MLLKIVFIIAFVHHNVFGDQIVLKIGGIFENITLHRNVFLNSNEILNEKQPLQFILLPIVNYDVWPENPFTALNGTCALFKQAIVGIFGPQSSLNFDIVRSTSESKGIPHILTTWVSPRKISGNSVNFYPHPFELNKAYFDIINYLKWETFIIIYTQPITLTKMKKFIMMVQENGGIIQIENIDPLQTGNYRNELRNLRNNGHRNFLIDCSIVQLKNISKQIQELGMLTDEYNYFLTNLDVHTEYFKAFTYSEATIYGIHLENNGDYRLRNNSVELCRIYKETFDQNCDSLLYGQPKLDSGTALLIDAIDAFSNALTIAKITHGESLSCDSPNFWEDGIVLTNILKQSTYEGITGKIAFDEDGFRNVFRLTIFKLREQITEIGVWSTSEGIVISQPDSDSTSEHKHLLVEIVLVEPYAMHKSSLENKTEDERFEGFAVDLIDEISKLEDFKYTLVVREDKKRGYFHHDVQEWTGMIGDVAKGEVDVAISDLSITKERVDAVDFTQPFMNLGISILYQKPSKRLPTFMDIFPMKFWKHFGLSFVAVVVSLFVIGRLCCCEWHKPESCIKETYLINQLTLVNTIWFVAGSLFKQNTRVKISSISGRIISGCWWAFCFITVVTYIGLSMSKSTFTTKKAFNDLIDLVEKSKTQGIKFGTVKGGSTEAFFKNSVIPLYQQIAKHMNDHPEDMVSTTRDGVERTETENYAFFMESTTIEYIVQEHCNLSMYGQLLGSKGFGIAVRKGSPLLTPLNRAILKMQTSGRIAEIKRKWWNERNENLCQIEPETKQKTIDLEQVEGLFWITLIGAMIAILCAIIELFFNIWRLSKTSQLTFSQCFKQEIGERFKKTSRIKNKHPENKEEIEM